MEEPKRYSRDIGEGVRQFVAVSASVALKQVREELGPDALIINQAQVGDRVIIEAALELPEVPEEISPEPEVEAAVPEPESEPEVGIEQKAPQELLVANTPIRELRGFYRFIGGSGVGKTSLVIKVAVEYAMCHGTQGLLVLTTDHERLAGSEQLELGCQMLGIQLLSRNPQDLSAAVESFSQKDLILVDSAAAEISNPSPVTGLTDVFVCSSEHSVPSLSAQRKLCRHARYTALTHMDRPGDHRATAEWLADSHQQLLLLSASGYIPEGLEAATHANIEKHFADSAVLGDTDTHISVAV